MKAANRIVVNTAVLYIKLLLAMAIGLITTRLVLAALGETDYGIYSLVAGVVGMLAFLQGAMSGASMRFLSYSVGTGDQDNIIKTFNTTLFLHIVLGIILVVIMELGGIVMFKYFLNIPEAKILDAKIIFHFMVITTFFAVISVPYDAVMNSHENMLVLSLIDLLGNILRLGVAIFLTYSTTNLLIMYGLFMLIIQIILRLIKQWYSSKKYPECKINFSEYVDKSVIKSILSFSAWNLLGAIASISANQVKSILLNMFFGVRLNAANGIASTVSSQVNTVSTSMTKAIRPQLIKSEGSGNRIKMLRITEISTKYSIFLFALFAIPVIIELPYLLDIWLKEIPAYSIVFCRLILVGLFVDKLSFEIGAAISAVGNIRSMSIAETIVILLAVLVSYVFFKHGYPPYTIFIVNILFSFVVFLFRLYFGKSIAELNILNFLKNSIFPVVGPVLITYILALLPQLFIPEGLLRLIITVIGSLLTLVLLFGYFGLTNSEFLKFKSILSSGKNKLKVLFTINKNLCF